MSIARQFSNALYDLAYRRARMLGVNLDRCPVCGIDPDNTHDMAERLEAERRGEEVPRPCEDRQCVRRLAHLRYFLGAGISPLQYNFDWSSATETPVTRAVNQYIANFGEYVKQGYGLPFLAQNYGSGKTTAVAKLLEHGIVNESLMGQLVSFQDIISSYRRDDVDEFEY